MTYKYSHTENFDGSVTRKKYEQFTRSDGSTFLDKPNTKNLAPQYKNADDAWQDTSLSGESAETQEFCNRYWTDAVKAIYRNNN